MPVDIPNVHDFLARKDSDQWRLKASPKQSTTTSYHPNEMCPECGQAPVVCDIEHIGGTTYMDATCASGHEYTIREPPTYAGVFG